MSDETVTNRNVLKPVRCGCGGEAEARMYCMSLAPKDRTYMVVCPQCYIRTKEYDTEAEAIEAWNRAMDGSCRKCNNHDERTAKIMNRSEGFYSAHGICICGHCENCGNAVCDDFRFCPYCGSVLDWSE